MRKVKSGNVNLYEIATPGLVTIGSPATGTITGTTYHHPQVNYYCSNKGEDVVTELGSGNTYSKKFRKLAIKYFSDCPELLEKINATYFKRRDILGVFDFYYKNCKPKQ